MKSKQSRSARNEARRQANEAARSRGEVRVAPKGSAKPKAQEPRDGLAWLIKKGRLTLAQAREALLYREGFRDAGEVAMRSSLEVGVCGGQPSGLPNAAVFAMTKARQELALSRYKVLRGQVDMLTVMDGVCGHGYTLRHLAGGDHHRAAELEVALRIALDVLVAYRAGPPASARAA